MCFENDNVAVYEVEIPNGPFNDTTSLFLSSKQSKHIHCCGFRNRKFRFYDVDDRAVQKHDLFEDMFNLFKKTKRAFPCLALFKNLYQTIMNEETKRTYSSSYVCWSWICGLGWAENTADRRMLQNAIDVYFEVKCLMNQTCVSSSASSNRHQFRTWLPGLVWFGSLALIHSIEDERGVYQNMKNAWAVSGCGCLEIKVLCVMSNMR